jgi:DNA-binding transcriptional LysR family regulator
MHAELAAHRAGEVGEVTIAGFASTLASLILPAVGLMKADHPHLRTVLAEVDPPASYELLARGEADVVIGVESPVIAVIDSRFHKVSLVYEAFDVALPIGHRLAAAPSLALTDLAHDPWIFATVGMCQDIPLAACSAAGFTPSAVHAIGDWTATFVAVALGMGICLVPQLAPAAANSEVVLRTLVDAPVRHLFAVVRDGSQKAPEIASALRALQQTAQATAA